MQKITIFLIFLLMVSSCTTTKPSKPSDINDFPVKPELTHYSTPPVIKKVDDNYLVTKDLITNVTILTDYYKRLEAWKEVKNIR